jgi:putative ABC transport system permease protein
MSVSATGGVNAKVYRNDKIPSEESGGLAVLAAKTDLLDTVGGTIASGTWLNTATSAYPAVVLGATAAQRLGLGALSSSRTVTPQVWIGDHWFTVVGILRSVPLAPELDRSVLIGWPVARSVLGFDGYPTVVYTRTQPDSVTDVEAVLAATANPEHPNEVKVSRPSDALTAQNAADSALNGLLLGLGAVALLVGGVGVANTMVISVLERRSEIGLRRSLGATKGQIRLQFLVESLLLAALGGLAGVLIGIGVTTGYAAYQKWPSVVPAWASTGGVAATVVIGALAGLYPAWRAARLAPTEALGAT